MINATILTILIILSITVLIAFQMSVKKSLVMKFWVMAWVAYCLGLLFAVFSSVTDISFLLEIRKIAVAANLMFILFGSYALVHAKTPSYWYRFFLYMVLLGLVCMYYDLDALSYYLPVSVFQMVITLFTCYNIIIKWDAAYKTRLSIAAVIFVWGTYQSWSAIYELFWGTLSLGDISVELIVSNTMNITILILYIFSLHSSYEFSSNLYRDVVEKSNDALFYYVFKPYPSFKYINKSVQNITGYTDSAFYADPNLFSTIVAPDNIDNLKEIFDIQNKNEGTYIVKMVNRNLEEYWAEFYRSLIMDDNGNISAMLCHVRDVTAMHTAQMAQIEVTRSRNMLLSYISHELRTPITSIAGYMSAINDGVMSGEEEVREALEIISSKTFTLKTLIDDLDQLTKLETNQFTFDFMLTNVEELTTQMINDHYIEATASHDFEVEIEADISYLSKHWVIIDVVRINQVFSNLVTNAYKYAQDNKKMKWSFSIDPSEENFVVSVQDYGRGIRSKHLPHIFDKFYRADYADNANRQIEGRGLGLTLCKEMIIAHQGEIFVESIFGEGSKFTFILPLYQED